MPRKQRTGSGARAAAGTRGGVGGVVRCFVEHTELRRLLCNVAAVELAHAMVRAALRTG